MEDGHTEDERMNIVNLAPSNLCNISTNLSAGINKFSSHSCRSIAMTPPAYGFDRDIIARDNEQLIMQLINESNLLHLNSWYFLSQKFSSTVFDSTPLPILNKLIRYYDKHRLSQGSSRAPASESLWWHFYMNYTNKRLLHKKKVVLHYHGGDLRRKMSEGNKELIDKHGFSVLVDVPDLTCQLKNAQWLPISVPTEEELYKPLPKRDDSVIKVVHSPTSRELKKTVVLQKAIEALRQKYDIELMLIENMPYDKCMTLKKTAHIAFDNIEFGSYAGCSIEAMCHEQPTLVYLNDVSREQISEVSEEVGIEPPFVNVGDEKQPSIEYLNRVVEGKARNIITKEDYESVYENLERLIVDSDLRRELGERGRNWVRRVHNVKVVVKKLIDVYES
jgi:glycosyltransferase involved in cell wall biosynthesis